MDNKRFVYVHPTGTIEIILFVKNASKVLKTNLK